MIDIHTHIVPGVDDGANTIEESLQLIKSGLSQGVTQFFCTPHSDAFSYKIDVLGKFNKLKKTLKQNSLKTEIYLGSEIYCSPEIMKDVIKNLDRRIYPTMNQSRYVLIEFNAYNPFEKDAVSCVRDIIEAGYIPIVAHAERYAFSGTNATELLINEGALIQINAYSLKQEQKDKIKSVARTLIDMKYVTFMGSDTHRITHRPIIVKEGIRYAYEHYEKEYVDAVMFKNAKKLLIGG